MHRKRWITAIVALPFLIGLIYAGGAPFSILIGAVCVLTLCEYFRIVFDPRARSISGLLLLIALVTGALMVLGAHRNAQGMVVGLLAVNVVLCGAFSLTQFSDDPTILANLARQIQGVVYVPIPLCCIVWLRAGPDGMVWIFLLLAVIFAGDVGAYYVGSYFGRHRLCPAISPKKTIEGALGGLAANLVVGSAVKGLFLPQVPWTLAPIFFIAIGLAGQAGDLFESQLKRVSGIKDSGTILPGHGGFLDRIDALLFAAPLTYLFRDFIVF